MSVLVRLTEAQRGALRSLASVTVDAGEGGRALEGALAALDAAVPTFTDAEFSGVVGAAADAESLHDDDVEPGDPGYAEWRRRRAATDRALDRIRRLR